MDIEDFLEKWKIEDRYKETYYERYQHECEDECTDECELCFDEELCKFIAINEEIEDYKFVKIGEYDNPGITLTYYSLSLLFRNKTMKVIPIIFRLC